MALNQTPPLQSVNHEVFRPFFKCQKTIGETTQHCSALRLGPLEPWISTVFFWAISTGGWAMHPQNWMWNTRETTFQAASEEVWQIAPKVRYANLLPNRDRQSYSMIHLSIPHSEISGSWLGSGFLGGLLLASWNVGWFRETQRRHPKRPLKNLGKIWKIWANQWKMKEQWRSTMRKQVWCSNPRRSSRRYDPRRADQACHVQHGGPESWDPQRGQAGPRDHSKGGKHKKTPWRT